MTATPRTDPESQIGYQSEETLLPTSQFETILAQDTHLIVGAAGHVGAHVEVSRGVDKHNLESTVELGERGLREGKKGIKCDCDP